MIPGLLTGPSHPCPTLAAEVQVLKLRTGRITPLLKTQQCSRLCRGESLQDPLGSTKSSRSLSLGSGLLMPSALPTSDPSPIPKHARLLRASLPCLPPSFTFHECPHSCQPRQHQTQLKIKSFLNSLTPLVEVTPAPDFGPTLCRGRTLPPRLQPTSALSADAPASLTDLRQRGVLGMMMLMMDLLRACYVPALPEDGTWVNVLPVLL